MQNDGEEIYNFRVIYMNNAAAGAKASFSLLLRVTWSGDL